MTDFVLDNSVCMRWCFENASHPYADNILVRLDTCQAYVPALWRYEVSAVLAKAQKSGVLAQARAAAFITLLQSLNIVLDGESLERVFSDVHWLAITHGLTSYDAAYLELAVRRDLPLATLDEKLIHACRAISHPVA